jgi:hypothetical protein
VQPAHGDGDDPGRRKLDDEGHDVDSEAVGQGFGGQRSPVGAEGGPLPGVLLGQIGVHLAHEPHDRVDVVAGRRTGPLLAEVHGRDPTGAQRGGAREPTLHIAVVTN